jgi:hypothetical protein
MSKVILSEITTQGDENIINISAGSKLDLSRSNSYLQLPKGNTSERPSNAVSGSIRYNTDTKLVEYYDGTQWQEIEYPEDYNDITKAGLVLHLDASSEESYPRVGNTIFNLSSSNIAQSCTLDEGASFLENEKTFDINGNPQHIDFGSDILFKSSGGWTTIHWVKYDSIAGAYDNITSPANFIGSESILHNSWYWSVLEGKLALWNRSPGTWRYGSTSLQTNVWYQVVLTCSNDGTKYQMYLNGVAEGGDHVTYSWNATYSGLLVRYIGRGNTTYRRTTNGQFASVEFYDRVLTPGEIWKNYVALAPRFGINPIPSIVTNGLIMNLDPANYQSYPRSGSTISDLSSNNNDGIFGSGSASPTYNSSNGGNLFFDGGDDHINIGTATQVGINTVSNSFSYSVWFKTNGSTEYYLLDNYDGSPEDISLRLDNAQLEVYLNSAGGGINVPRFGNYILGQWNYAVYVWNGSTKTITCYLNNANVGSLSNTSMTGSFESGSTLQIGRRPAGGGQFPGNIGAVHMYNRALSAAEVQQNFNALRNRYGI